MAFSLFDHPHFSKLLQRDEIADLFTSKAEIAAMLHFELALAESEAELGLIPSEAAIAITSAIQTFQPTTGQLAEGIRRDGVIGPTLVYGLRQATPEPHRRHVHFGATSQDIIDTGLILRLKQILFILRGDLETVSFQLSELASIEGHKKIMGRTRMQRALPITFADRIATWRGPIVQQLDALDDLERHVLAVQFGGAVGTLDQLGERGVAVRAALAKRLDLTDPGRAWHVERDRIADLAHWLTKISGCAGKIGQDLVLMAQNEIGEVKLTQGGTSSAMAHKRNPIQAEILIALARYNAGHLASLHQAMVHEGERSGAAWTLEWLTLPAMIATTGAALAILRDSLSGLSVIQQD
ncbi:MAG: 3-carboxy-cis,cis-muconate cycloisomerase [Geminicoccales bacterium]